MLPLSPPYLPMHETIFCQKTEVLAATSNFRAEQNLVHFGKFLHFNQKVVGVTLRLIASLATAHKNHLNCLTVTVKQQLHDAIYRLRFYSNSLIHILSLSNWHNNVASIQKNWGDKSHRVIVALSCNYTMRFIGYDSIETR